MKCLVPSDGSAGRKIFARGPRHGMTGSRKQGGRVESEALDSGKGASPLHPLPWAHLSSDSRRQSIYPGGINRSQSVLESQVVLLGVPADIGQIGQVRKRASAERLNSQQLVGTRPLQVFDYAATSAPPTPPAWLSSATKSWALTPISMRSSRFRSAGADGDGGTLRRRHEGLLQRDRRAGAGSYRTGTSPRNPGDQQRGGARQLWARRQSVSGRGNPSGEAPSRAAPTPSV
jgi:hypothetical protein